MQIPKPYLLFLGDVEDPLAIKMARGIHRWRPGSCVGQLRLSDKTPSLDIQDMTLEEGRKAGAKTLVLGVTAAGGRLSPSWIETLRSALEAGYHLASGMHQRLADIPELAETAKKMGVRLFDIRHSAPELDVGNGKKRSGKRILTVGLDCAVGKMYTALSVNEALLARGEKSDFRATGQSGILIEGSGIAIDAVVADFISGAAEWVSPANDANHWDVIEGQGSLFNPSFAGVSMGLLHGSQPDYLIMCHELKRPHMRHLPHFPLPTYEQCVTANLMHARTTNPNVQLAGFAINTSAVGEDEAREHLASLEKTYGVPATDPVRFGVDNLIETLLQPCVEQ